MKREILEPRDHYTIAQFSDMHCGDVRFDESLVEEMLGEINDACPDLVVVAGDLTAGGYREQFEEAKHFIDRLQCSQIIVIAGNHDCRNVGYLHFEELIGPRYQTVELDFRVSRGGSRDQVQERVKILALDSNKPDLNDGEIGRDHYSWINEAFPRKEDYKIFVLHHHLVSIPGTGRERNVVWDSGDVLEKLRQADVDLVLHGHRHVPFNWPIGNTLIASSGTCSTWRTRGYTQPSYNVIEVWPEVMEIMTKVPGGEVARRERFHRRPRPPVPKS